MSLISKHLVKGIKLNTDSLPNMCSANRTVIKIGLLSKLELVMGVRILQIENVFFVIEQLAGTDKMVGNSLLFMHGVELHFRRKRIILITKTGKKVEIYMNEKTLIHIDRAQRIHNLNMVVDEDVAIYCNFDIVLQPQITIEIQDIVYKP